MLVLNLPFKALMFLTLMRPSLVLFLVLWLKLVQDFLKVRCRLALLPFLISCLIWLDLVASLPLIKERILVIILLFLKASHSFRNRLLVICKNAYLFATMIMTSVSSPFSCCSG